MSNLPPSEAPTCWVVTDGRVGIEAQALGLAEAIGRETPLAIVRKTVEVGSPWNRLPRQLWGDPFARVRPGGAQFEAPYPDIWIGCGRLSVPLTIAVKARSPRTFTVQIQDPRAPLNKFDLVIPPVHDRLIGPNVISIIGSPNRLPSANCVVKKPPNAAKKLAVLVGGPNRVFQFASKEARDLGEQLRLLADSGIELVVTTSRRTPADAVQVLNQALRVERAAATTFWREGSRGSDPNPYPQMLADADATIVTEDSVNMAVEAASTGRPVYIWRLRRRPFAVAGKFDAFHESLRARGAARFFDGRLEDWSYEPLNETAKAAKETLRRWRLSSSQARVR
ncbi:MAG: mitochondrial fission ELM1 family protein [Parvularculaceae bacterium]|nr:mitochondrial fission ELM1 family protein [Parvularculaceae bacterium]